MPEDEQGNKYFFAQGRNNVGEPLFTERYNYKVHSWKELNSTELREEEPTNDDLNKADYLVIEITKGDEPLFPRIFESSQWETIIGPTDYDSLEELLGEDFGEEGSRGTEA